MTTLDNVAAVVINPLAGGALSLGDRIDDALATQVDGLEAVTQLRALLHEIHGTGFAHPGAKSLELKLAMMQEKYGGCDAAIPAVGAAPTSAAVAADGSSGAAPLPSSLQRTHSSTGSGSATYGSRSLSSLSYESRSLSRTATVTPTRPNDAEHGVIHPRNATKVWWDGYILVLVLYSVTWELYTTTMGKGLQDSMTFIDWFVDISYWMDIALNFRTGYDEDGRGYRYIMNAQKSGVRYLKGWFLIDLVSTFPYVLFEATKDHLISLLRLLRVTRLVRVLAAGGNARELL